MWMRLMPMLLALPAMALGSDRDQAFLSALSAQPSERLQAELGVTEEQAATLIAVAREYQSQSQALDAAMRRAVFDRRMARMMGEGEGAASEAQLVEARQRLADQIAGGQMQQLRARLTEQQYQRVQGFMEARKDGEQFFDAPRAKGVPVPGAKSKAVPAQLRR